MRVLIFFLTVVLFSSCSKPEYKKIKHSGDSYLQEFKELTNSSSYKYFPLTELLMDIDSLSESIDIILDTINKTNYAQFAISYMNEYKHFLMDYSMDSSSYNFFWDKLTFYLPNEKFNYKWKKRIREIIFECRNHYYKVALDYAKRIETEANFASPITFDYTIDVKGNSYFDTPVLIPTMKTNTLEIFNNSNNYSDNVFLKENYLLLRNIDKYREFDTVNYTLKWYDRKLQDTILYNLSVINKTIELSAER